MRSCAVFFEVSCSVLLFFVFQSRYGRLVSTITTETLICFVSLLLVAFVVMCLLFLIL